MMKKEDLEQSIPFNRSSLEGRELEYIFRSVSSGQIAGDQSYSRKCERFMESVLSVERALVTTSCTHALEMASILYSIGEGDEVIVPSYTFVSTANAFALHGARPVFCDIRSDTLNIDENQIESLITKKTKAIVVVHYAGVGCEMDRIIQIANKHQIPVIEDNAHGLFGKYKGKYLGTFGSLATQSFHETKNVTCGEGGALLVNKEEFIDRAEIIREKGTNRSQFFRGEVDKYTWVDVGSSYVMSDVLAAFLAGQLEVWEKIQIKRRKLWECYNDSLNSWCADNGIKKPFVPSYCEQAYHMFYLLFPSIEAQEKFIDFLKFRGIKAVFHYQALHSSPIGRKFSDSTHPCPVSVDISQRIVRLPFYTSMRPSEQSFVISEILSYCPSV